MKEVRYLERPDPEVEGETSKSTCPQERRQGRQLVVFCDGTSNTLTGGSRDTNVLRLFTLLAGQKASGGPQRVLYYDPGVGSPDGVPGVDLTESLLRWWERIAGLAFGRGVFENVGQAYAFLCRTFQPRDLIYIFGFSRGAFTARSVAGMVHLFGLLRPEHEHLVPTLVRIYFGSNHESPSKARKFARGTVAQEVRESFTSEHGKYAWVHFVGVWDTVATVGLWPFDLKITSRATVSDKRFGHVRHALSLDEHRSPFAPRLYSENNFDRSHASGSVRMGRSLDQRWFRGVHCDVGGSYPTREAGLSTSALQWMLDEANACGLAGPTSVPPAHAAPVRHDVLCEGTVWALAGMTIRDTRHATGTDAGDRVPVKPFAVKRRHRPPTPAWVWTTARPWRPALRTFLWLVISAVLAIVAGGRCDVKGVLDTPIERWGRLACDSLDRWSSLLRDRTFALWDPGVISARLDSWSARATRTSCLLDLAFVGAFVWFLGRMGTRSFAVWAGARAVRAPKPRLAFLGGAVKWFAILAALEDVLGALAANAWRSDCGLRLANLTGAAAVLKWTSLVGCVALIGLRVCPRGGGALRNGRGHRRSPPPPPPSAAGNQGGAPEV